MDNFEQFRQLMSGINFDATIVIGVIVIIATFIIECVLLNKSYINIKSSKKVDPAQIIREADQRVISGRYPVIYKNADDILKDSKKD